VLLLDAGKEAPSFPVMLVSPPAMAPRSIMVFKASPRRCSSERWPSALEKWPPERPHFALRRLNTLKTMGSILAISSAMLVGNKAAAQSVRFLVFSFTLDLNFPQIQMQASNLTLSELGELSKKIAYLVCANYRCTN
jgi:hypothetical protein